MNQMDTESRRLTALRRYGVLDTPPSESLDRIARTAARLFGVSSALVALIDRDRQWNKSCFNFGLREIDRGDSFCTHAVGSEDVLVVEDALDNERFRENPFVTGPPHIRFYAGAPLVTADGYPIGVFCVFDGATRTFSAEQRSCLKDFAAMAMSELDQRRQAAASTQALPGGVDVDIRQREAAETALSRRLDLQRAVASVSEELLSGRADFDYIVQALGDAAGADRAYLFEMEGAGPLFSCEYEWDAPGADPIMARTQGLSTEDFSWWREAIRGRDALPLVVSELPPEAEFEQAYWSAIDIQSILDVPIRLADGTLWGFIGLNHTQTEHHWTEEDIRLLRLVANLISSYLEDRRRQEALRQSEERLRLITETVTQGFWMASQDIREIHYLSPAFEQIWGRPRERYYENPTAWLDAVHPDDLQRVWEALREQPDLDTSEVEFRIIRPDGEVRCLHVQAFLVDSAKDADQQQRRMVGVTEDITLRKRHEEALRQSEARFRTVVENARDIVFQTDAEGRYELLSPSWERIMGYSVAESLGRRFTEYLHPDEPDTVEAHRRMRDDDRMRDDEHREKHQSRFVTKEGDVRWMQVKDRLLRDENGQVTGVTGSLIDVTDSVRMEAEREARQRAEELLEAKTSLMNNVSHELRTPLAAILGFADVLEEEAGGLQQEFAARIGESGRRLERTLDSVLSFAQLESGAAELDLKPIDVAAAVREAATMHEPAAKGKELYLEVDITSGAEHMAKGDMGALHRVLDNLLSNAVKFTDEGGITVRVDTPEPAEAGGEEVRVHVEDTGIGIAEDFQEKLFEDFEQESRGLGRTHEGIGLGLAITQRLMDIMEGRIEVASRKGEGARFTVVLPLAQPEDMQEAKELVSTQAPPTESEPLELKGDSGKEQDQGCTDESTREGSLPGEARAARVLVVEDNLPTLRLAEHILAKRFDVTRATGTAAAMAAVREKPHDVLFIDINLTEMKDGVHLLGRIRALEGYGSVPAVAFTAHAQPGDEEHYLKAGFDGYLAKPFTKQELIEAADEAIAGEAQQAN